MFRPGNIGHLGRLGLVAASQPSLVAQALAILAKYGSAANLYLPGVGAINGITAGNWLDTVGGTAATVDGAVGAVVNARGGANLTQATTANQPILRRGLVNQLTQSDFQNGVTDAPTRGGLVTASTLAGYGGAIAFGHDGSATSYGYKFFAATLNAAYTLAFVVKMDDGNAPVFGNVNNQDASNPFAAVMYGNAYSPIGAGGDTVTALADNTYLVTCSAVATAAGATNFGVVKYPTNNNRTFKVTRYGLFTGTVTASQILAAGGIPVTTTAPASSTNGPFAWQFDGSNDSFNSVLTTGNEGWFCAGVAFDSGQDAYSALLYAGEVDVAKKSVYLFKGTNGFNARKVALAISDGTNRYILNFPYQVAVGVPVVVDCGWSSVQRFIAVNGSVTSESSANTYGPSAGAAQIGTYFGSNNLNGRMFPIFFAPTVLPTVTERATLRQFIASLSGVTM